MKIFLATAIIVVLGSTSAFAQSATNANSGATSNSEINFNQPANTRSNIRSTPSAIAPGLVSSAVETCLGSASVGGSGMGWGAAFGLTVTDKGCEARLDAKIMAQLGDSPAAKERLCDQPKMRAAYARAGRPCMADAQQMVRQTRTSGRQVAQRRETTKRMRIADMASGQKYYLNGVLHTKQ